MQTWSGLLLRAVAAALTIFTFSAPGHAGEIAPGVSVRERNYDAPINELPFYGFLPKTEGQLKADATFIDAFNGQGKPSRQEGVEYFLELAQQFIQKKDYAIAARRLNQVWLLRQDLSAVPHLFGIIMVNRFRDTGYALELMQAAARLKDPLPTLPADHARTLLLAKRPAEAIPLLRQAIEKTPDWAVPRSNLAQALLETGDRTGACAAAAEVRGKEMDTVSADLEALKRRAGCR